MRVLVDTSVWIDYFKSGVDSTEVDKLIENNVVYTNDLILTELIPYLRLKNQISIINIIKEISVFPLFIDWLEIQDFQFKCLKSGLNGIGIPDLIIAQNAKQNNGYIFTFDKHFNLSKDILSINVYI
jgi:predicted nucleic acid-binding protein